MQKYKSNITTTSGAAVRNVPVHVLAEDGSNAAIFLDRAGTVPAPNPLTTGPDGVFYFYAVNGRYSLRTTVDGVTITDDDVVLMMDPEEITVAGPIAEAVAAAQAAATAAETAVADSGIQVLVSSAQNAVVDANAALAQAIASSNSAALSKTDADAARDAAVTAKMAAEAALDSFDDRYLGAKAVAPTVDNDGAALLIGALYWDTALPGMRSWNGSAWVTLQAATAAAISNTPAGSIAATTVQSAIDELDAEKAPLSSPALTGTPTAPTAAPGTNTTQLATTEYARAAAIAFGGIKAYATKAEAAIASALLPDGADVEVSQDETRAGARTRYKVQAGALVFVVNLDQLRLDLAAATGASLVGFQQEGTGAVSTTVQSKLRESVSVKDFGAVGDGVTDDAAAITAAFVACPEYGEVYFTPGLYITGSQLAIPTNRITVDGRGATVKAKDGSNFDFLFRGVGCTGCVVKNITLDANKAGRTATQTGRFMGADFTSSQDCLFENVIVKNTRGYAGIPAVGLAIVEGIRNRVHRCTFIDCGDAAPNASDGVYTFGESTLISDCIAFNCTDTAFVLENSNYSGIVGCTANACAVGIGITAATNSDYRGNFASGVIIHNWNSPVTGGIQIGCPSVGMTGNLYDTTLTGITMTASTPTYGNGPAVNIRKVAGSGKAIGLSINGLTVQGSGVTRNGATQQGVVVNGDYIRVRNADIQTAEVGVNFLTGSIGGLVSGCTITGGTFAVANSGDAKSVAQNNICDGQSSWGVYAFDTSTLTLLFNTITNATAGAVGKDAGATISALGMFDNNLSVNNATGSAPVGALVNKFVVLDKNQIPLGYVPVYAN